MILTSDAGYWRAQLQRPLIERLAVAPVELLAYVANVNASQNLDKNFPEAVLPEADFLDDVRSAITEMPVAVLKMLERPLLGVYFARGLGSSALTDVVMAADGSSLGMVCLMDADAFLQRSANAWASWKENTPFLPQDNYSIEVVIETAENDNRKNAIQFLLLHEFGHVLTANSEFLPDWWIGAQKFRSTEEYSYLSLSWQIAMSGDLIPLLREDFQYRKRLSFYTGEQLPGDLIPEIYRALQKTTFPTLYAATNAYDDFADGFASYVHQLVMQRPLTVSIKSANETIVQIADYWSSPRARLKAGIFAEMLASA
ncbi:hypothetical protein [Undibacterium sp. TJN19]|uniref:hypothetical protein n=1 Tax=Undibacterium sp. TJN19 TaxID=3413055 RepID=UPI003BF2ACEC